jgi:membrane protein YdbS with pleckstrin-like domain/ribosomal protein S27E
MIDATCPYCGTHQTVDEIRAGREIYCQSCGAKFEIEGSGTGGASAPTAQGEFHWEGRPVCRAQLGMWILGIVLLPIGVGLIFLGKALLHKYSRYYIVTSTHIITRHGILSVDTHQIAVKDIRSIEVQATLWQRLLGIRRVEIATAGTEGVDVALLGIPAEIAEAVQHLQVKQGRGHDD